MSYNSLEKIQSVVCKIYFVKLVGWVSESYMEKASMAVLQPTRAIVINISQPKTKKPNILPGRASGKSLVSQALMSLKLC